MEYRRLGRCGLKVSELCLGTMAFGTVADEAEAERIVDLAYGAGINFFDTADAYGKGRSEEVLGKLLKGRRRQAVVATKFFNPMGPGPNDSGMSRVHIMHAIEDSLRRLQMDEVDIYYIHHVDVQTPLEEMLRALDDLVHQGKVRYIACSNYQAWRLCEALCISTARDLARFECYQPQYSLVVRDIEQELVPLCLHQRLGIVAWGPLGSGFLSGKYAPGQRVVPGTRSEEQWAWHGRFFASNADQTLATLLDVARELGRTPAQVALRWVLEQPAVSSVITGVRTTEQLRDNVGATGWRLEGEPLERLSEVSHLPDRYPESFEHAMDERREAALRMPSLRGSGRPRGSVEDVGGEDAMKSYRKELWFRTTERVAFINITPEVEACLAESGVREGLCLVNAMHITASVFINDAERGLHADYREWLERLAPHAPTGQYRHNMTGEDNADAHMKRQVMGREVVVAITEGRLDFGPWEQIFYGEFDGRRRKRVLVKIIGE